MRVPEIAGTRRIGPAPSGPSLSTHRFIKLTSSSFDLAKLDKAIAVLEGLFGKGTTSPNGHAGKRTLSPAARKKIGKAQKLRWAKLKQQAGKK